MLYVVVALALIVITSLIVLPIVLPIYFLIRATKKKTKMGINFKKVVCPKCGTPAPRIRKPANMRQILFGGWTCKICETEFDKWGRLINGKDAA